MHPCRACSNCDPTCESCDPATGNCLPLPGTCKINNVCKKYGDLKAQPTANEQCYKCLAGTDVTSRLNWQFDAGANCNDGDICT